MTNDYNSIAGVYDLLSKLIFQQSIIKAQKFLVAYIPVNCSILIVGGGTGWILELIADMHQSNINITYVEKSAEMIALSKKRNYKSNAVEFVHSGIEDFISDRKFDIIFTAFVLDNFKADKGELVFNKLHQSLKQNGLWLYADFANDAYVKFWQRFLLKTMYVFFKLTCNIETQKLINIKNLFGNEYVKVDEAFFYRRFIVSEIYRKMQITNTIASIKQ